MHRIHPLRTTVRFRHWSRKGYAAFASLGRCVTIGQLRKNVTERALTKQTEPSLLPTTQKHPSEPEAESPESRATLPADNALWLLRIVPKIETTSTAGAERPSRHCTISDRDALNASCDDGNPHTTGPVRKAHSMRFCLLSPLLL